MSKHQKPSLSNWFISLILTKEKQRIWYKWAKLFYKKDYRKMRNSFWNYRELGLKSPWSTSGRQREFRVESEWIPMFIESATSSDGLRQTTRMRLKTNFSSCFQKITGLNSTSLLLDSGKFSVTLKSLSVHSARSILNAHPLNYRILTNSNGEIIVFPS